MTDEYITSTISAEIPEFLEKYVDGKTITFYKVNITNNFSKQNWTLEKRYSEFEYLYKTLVAIVPNVPIIPGKSLFRVTAYDALTKRRLQLEAFIKECANRKDILSNVSLSIGIVTMQKVSLRLDDILHKCDSAMYEAKYDGKNRYVFYRENDRTIRRNRNMELEMDRLIAVTIYICDLRTLLLLCDH